VITAIIQARMGSTRLPEKTLADLHGKSLLERVIDRAAAIRGVERVVVATTELPEDDPIAACAAGCGIGVYRGPVDDVLARFAGAARMVGASVIVRITADDPFKSPEVCSRVLAEFLRRAPDVDYVSNTVEPTWPEGLDVEVFSRKALERADREAGLRSEREHVTPYIYGHPDRFRNVQVKHSEDLSALRWTLDYPEDLAFARAVYERLDRGPIFDMDSILALLDAEPALKDMNRGFLRNAGYLKSLAEEQSQP
jgi:spore coat polysaccharide biosynthesis protein SpsF